MIDLQPRKKTTDPLKRPPHSIEAEQAILGGLMLENQALDKISMKLCEQDFYRGEHRVLFRAMVSLTQKSQPFDLVTIVDHLKSLHALDDAGGETYLFELASNTPSIANVSAYADIVREKSVQRQLITVATDIADAAYSDTSKSIEDVKTDWYGKAQNAFKAADGRDVYGTPMKEARLVGGKSKKRRVQRRKSVRRRRMSNRKR